MTHRFPHDFWAEQDLNSPTGLRFDASLPPGLRHRGSYGFSRGVDWDALAPEPPEDLLGQFIDETHLNEAEFDDEPLDDGPHASLVNDLHPAAASTGLFLPEKYEPNYPYPLVLWFHDAGGDANDLLSVMPQISERNYFGLSLGGPISLGTSADAGFDWPRQTDAVSRLERTIYYTVCELRRSFHIHSERIFLAGAGTGATIALRLLWNRAEWFAGAFALGGELPPFDEQEALPAELSESRVFLTTPPGDDQNEIRRWQDAGLDLTAQPDETPASVSKTRLSQLNHWLMETICTPV